MNPTPKEAIQALRMKVGVILLGAGASSRMGRPKLLLPWAATTVLGHLIEQWRRLEAAQIAVVCGAGNQAMRAELDRLKFPSNERINNPTPEQGMFSSIQCAARWKEWKPDLTHWSIVLGDQPHLRAETLRALLDFGGKSPEKICQPGRHGRPRHPVLLPAPIFAQLKESRTKNLKEFLQVREVALCELDDPGLDLDLDHPTDYQKALALAFGPASADNPT